MNVYYKKPIGGGGELMMAAVHPPLPPDIADLVQTLTRTHDMDSDVRNVIPDGFEF